MILENEIKKIKSLIFELSPKSTGVQELMSIVQDHPEIIKDLGFGSLKHFKEVLSDADYDDFDEIRNEIEGYLNRKEETFQEEIEEIERTTQELAKKEEIFISSEELVNAFRKSKEVDLTKDIWRKLENTESNKIKKGEMKKVLSIADFYKKYSPLELKKVLKSGEYRRPLILSFNNRYYLVAGNTRLSTAAALGITPKVFIATI